MSLRELIEAVERGDEDAVEKAARAIRSASLDRGEVSWIDVHGVAKAFNGSLDAAKALHDAMLPGWEWNLDAGDGAYVEHRGRFGETYSANTTVGNIARAWLLSILRAMEAEGPQ